ncbi:STAS domain-containing protein [candidate division GN15 bacterium]|nr:STAS domain-containing protein [candidate division GN15 bacterium]
MVKRLFPFLEWFEGYSTAKLRGDLIGGVTVALVLIPQSMAYAQLAGLPAYYGLYAAFLPPLIAALFGSSRQLATGPVAVVSLMTAATLEPLATAGTEAYIAYAILLALLVGIFQFLLGLFRLGLVVNFLSHPVVNGFTSAAAIIIGTSQLSKLFGVYVNKGHYHFQTIYNVIAAATDYIHWPTLALGALAFVIMIGIKKLNPRLPGVLIAAVVTTLISWATGFENNRLVTLDQIVSSNVRTLITEYNETVHTIQEKAEQRVVLNDRQQELREQTGSSPEEVLDLVHRVRLINHEIEALKEEAAHARAELRHVRLMAVDTLADSSQLYTRPHEVSGSVGDAVRWRIRVGERALDPTSIKLMGGGAVVGEIPAGLPSFKAPSFDLETVLGLLPMVIVISILGFMEAISIAKAMASRTGQRLNPDQELIGQGLANMVGCFNQSYAVSGSFSRSAVNIQAGAQTGLSSVFSSAVVGVTLILFTPLLYHLPQSVLAAVIMMAVFGLLNVRGFTRAYRAQRYDGIIGIITFVATLLFAPHLDRGIFIGVALSLSLLLLRNIKPDIAMLSMHTDGTYRNAERLGLQRCRHIAVIRFNGSLIFANVAYLEEQVMHQVQTMPELRYVLIVGNGINELDASGEEKLAELVDRLRESGYDLVMSGLNDAVLDVMRRTLLYEKIGEDHLFRNATRALEAIHDEAHRGSDESPCPLFKVRFIGFKAAREVRRGWNEK